MFKEIVQRTLRVPILYTVQGNGESITRQLDIALMAVGFKLSKDAIEYFSEQDPLVAIEVAQLLLPTVKELVGEHVQHNVYFIDFPENVPNTPDFWWTEFFRLLITGQTQYGQYQHTYQDMLAVHDAFIPSLKDRVTLLHLGKTLPEETLDLYHTLAESRIPLNDADKKLVRKLAEACLTRPQPEAIPVRETKALINGVRLQHNHSLLVDTVTDVLRLACAVSDGDVTLQEGTRFISFKRPVRHTMLKALDEIVQQAPHQLSDVHQYSERWKRLGERLHPHEYAQYTSAQDVFAVARGAKKVSSLEAHVELAFHDGDIAKALSLLSAKPGTLFRNADRIARVANEQEQERLLATMQNLIDRVSGRVILSLREHIYNRTVQDSSRVFTNKRGTAWVTSKTLQALDEHIVQRFIAMFDQELQRRIPPMHNLVIDPEILRVALPLSDRNKADGFGVLPRGSTTSITEGIVRFFVYWKQASERTDYDLSAILLDDNFAVIDRLSYTRLQSLGGVHSGDLVEAPNGASEFIDIDLRKVHAKYVLPTVNIYAGERFTEVETCFFGMMERTMEQMGKPFEATTVRIKSDMRGKGRVAMPLVFIKDDAGSWSAKWMHVYLNGQPRFNRVEINGLDASVLARSILDHHYLNFQYLVEFMKQRTDEFSWYTNDTNLEAKPVTFIGLEVPEKIHKDSKVYSAKNLHELIPS